VRPREESPDSRGKLIGLAERNEKIEKAVSLCRLRASLPHEALRFIPQSTLVTASLQSRKYPNRYRTMVVTDT
jgi:hypothetical protein